MLSGCEITLLDIVLFWFNGFHTAMWIVAIASNGRWRVGWFTRLASLISFIAGIIRVVNLAASWGLKAY